MAVKDKRILREIARRWVKGIVLASSASCSFDVTGLSDDEMDEIQKEVEKIAERITPSQQAFDTISLVEEYYD